MLEYLLCPHRIKYNTCLYRWYIYTKHFIITVLCVKYTLLVSSHATRHCTLIFGAIDVQRKAHLQFFASWVHCDLCLSHMPTQHIVFWVSMFPPKDTLQYNRTTKLSEYQGEVAFCSEIHCHICSCRIASPPLLLWSLRHNIQETKESQISLKLGVEGPL